MPILFHDCINSTRTKVYIEFCYVWFVQFSFSLLCHNFAFVCNMKLIQAIIVLILLSSNNDIVIKSNWMWYIHHIIFGYYSQNKSKHNTMHGVLYMFIYLDEESWRWTKMCVLLDKLISLISINMIFCLDYLKSSAEKTETSYLFT